MAFEIDSVVRGYHVYKDVWDAHIGVVLPCLPEMSNREDRYAVAVMDGDIVVGHVPRKISFICNLFLRHSGIMLCKVTGPRQYSSDLVQGGLEVPCKYEFYLEDKCPDDTTFKKVKGLIEKASYTAKSIAIEAQSSHKLDASKSSSKSIEVRHNISSVDCEDQVESADSKTKRNTSPVDGENQVESAKHNASPVDDKDQVKSTKNKPKGNPSKRVNLDLNDNSDGKKEWVRRGGIKLTLSDRDSIIRGERLNDMVINVAQKLLKSHFSKLKGFQSTLLQNKKCSSTFELNKVQIIHSRGDHWIAAATVRSEEHVVEIFDSIYDSVDDGTKRVILNIFGSLAVPQNVKIAKQTGVDDCGLYAIANATCVCFGQDPALMKFNQNLMRLHLAQCIDNKKITPFPQLV